MFDLWKVVSLQKKLVFWLTVSTTFCALLYALFATPIYRAEVLMAPAGDQGDNGNPLSLISSQLGGLGGFGSMIGLGGSGTNSQTTLAILKSREFTLAYIDERNLMPILFADRWDAEKGEWKGPALIDRIVSAVSGLFDGASNEDKENDGAPSLWDAYDMVSNGILSVSTDDKTGLLTLSIEWEDPYLAAEWANGVVARVNEHIRRRDVVEAEKSVEFLRGKLNPTLPVTVEQAMYGLIEEQTKIIMLANVREEYAFEVIDPAVVPERISRPDRKLTVVLGLMVGLVLGFVAALARNFYNNQQVADSGD